MEKDEYLSLFENQITVAEYLKFEKERIKKKGIKGDNWIDIIKKQEFKCYYCDTHLNIIQELIIHKKIGLRKRGKFGFSGMHFEVEHKDSDKNNNKLENLSAACYYCNNDKSNTIKSDVFKNYFGISKNEAFEKLFIDSKLQQADLLRHHYKRKK